MAQGETIRQDQLNNQQKNRYRSIDRQKTTMEAFKDTRCYARYLFRYLAVWDFLDLMISSGGP